eukprot:15229426-Heterocapsa_arctica.AAC.1
MHWDPLVVMSAYIPHDAVHEDHILTVWEHLSDRINQVPASKNLIILGDLNVQLHARKESEEHYIGLHIFGRGADFLRRKYILQADKVFNRNSL